MKKRLWFPALVALFALRAWALPGESLDNFGPFRNDEKVPTLEMKNLDLSESSQMGSIQSQKWGIKDDPQAPTWTIQNNLTDTNKPSILFQLARPKKKKPLKFKLPGMEFRGLYTADLNGDGLPDYVLTLGAPTKAAPEDPDVDTEGLPPDNAGFVVVLSGKKAYRAFLVENAVFDPEGVYQLGVPPAAAILHTVDFKEEKSSLPPEIQGRVIFHLYQLLSVKGNELALDNGLEKRFPKIVAQDFGAMHKNHKETKLLTDARKKELLSLYQPKITELHFIK